jgi:hypothetical protein
MASWAIDAGGVLRNKWRDQLGDDEFETRRQVAADKLAEFPQSEWNKLKDRDYKFWSALVVKVCT